jgi:predicted CoA-binding protein
MSAAVDTDAETRQILTSARTIAVVGLSDKPERDSNEVARYLRSEGYRIIPVNPTLHEVLGEVSYPSISAIPSDVRIDIVDIFRRSDQVAPVVEEALERGVGAIWMQLGVANAEAAEQAEAAGVPVVQDRCIMQEHRRLQIGPVPLNPR